MERGAVGAADWGLQGVSGDVLSTVGNAVWGTGQGTNLMPKNVTVLLILKKNGTTIPQLFKPVTWGPH